LRSNVPRGGFEEGLDCCIVITIAFAAHGHLEPVLAQDLLVVVRTILAAAIRVMNAALGWLPERDARGGPRYSSRLQPC
jgi:hypothetical protein